MSEEFSLAQWVSDGAKAVRDSLHFPTGGILPEEFHQHMKTSRKEFLLAMRSLIDTTVERIETPKSSTRKKATKIKVE